MRTSETTTKIFPAFIKAQAEFNKAQKSATAHYGKYANLDSYINGSAKGLENNELAIMQDTFGPEEKQIINVTTTIIHSSGEWMTSEPLTLKPSDMKAVSFGSAQTYARRYSMSSFLGMTATDDDGVKASEAPKMPTRASVNGELLELTNIEDFNDYAKRFQSIHSKNVWTQLSGKRGNKTETWKNVFDTQKDRINGVSPIDNRTPEQLQVDFDQLINNPGDNWVNFDEAEKMLGEFNTLKVTKNKKNLANLKAELIIELGDR